MVDLLGGRLEWEVLNQFGPGYDNNHRCFQERVGSNMWDQEMPGSLDGGREIFSHKYFGVDESSVCNKNFLSQFGKYPCSFTNGQQNSGSIYSENGRDQIPAIIENNEGDLEVLSSEENFCNSRVSPGFRECGSRQAVSQFQGQQRLASEGECVFEVEHNLGLFHTRLFCQSTQHNTQLERYISWKADPFAVWIYAFQRTSTEEGLYLFPPFSIIPRCRLKL